MSARRGNRYRREVGLSPFGERLRALLAGRAMPRVAFLAETGIPHATLYTYETTSRLPPLRTLLTMAAVLGCDIGDVAEGRGGGILPRPPDPTAAFRTRAVAGIEIGGQGPWKFCPHCGGKLT